MDRLTSVPIKEKLGLLRDHERRWRQMILTPRLQPIECPDPPGTWIDSELRDGLLVQVYYNDDTEQSTVILDQLPTCLNPMDGSSSRNSLAYVYDFEVENFVIDRHDDFLILKRTTEEE